MNKIELNRRLSQGDPEAFESIFKLTYPRLISYCRLFITNDAQAEDLVQECFVHLWRKRNTIAPSQSTESFLFVMLKHRCLNFIRDNHFLVLKEDINLVKINELQQLFEIDFTNSENKTIEEELLDALSEEIEKLPEKRKLVFVKSKIEGLKNREIAEQLGISIKTVEKHLHQAKEQIQKELTTKFPLYGALLALFLK
ncbi:RNA polymerase sigma-70 factor [Prolixibacter bellariivorans]|nr:RNA polymerase sigma-70 factor [Prolixibacter bellariivorans]